MNARTCNLCFRSFSNGRALAGHMRSHVLPAGLPARSRANGYGYSSGSTSSGHAPAGKEEDEVAAEEAVSYGLRMNPRKSFRLVDPEFSSSFLAIDPAAPCEVIVQDRESETESPRSHRPRTKCPRRVAAPRPTQPEADLASSVSDASSSEDVALCLMMLSRDSWAAAPDEGRPSDGSDDDGSDEDDGHRRAAARSRRPSPQRKRRRRRYQCGACKKVFHSYQALGGHRASHKRTNSCVTALARRINGEADSVDANADAKLHECPFCFKVFASGQALGGHKRSHMASYATADRSPSSARPARQGTSPVLAATKYDTRFNIDLNVAPAPTEDDFELSAISDLNQLDSHVPHVETTQSEHSF